MGAISGKRNAKTANLFSAFDSYRFYYIYFIDICQSFFSISPKEKGLAFYQTHFPYSFS